MSKTLPDIKKELRMLKCKIHNAEHELNANKEKARVITRKINSNIETIKGYKDRSKALENRYSSKVKDNITDHAIVRYMERIMGINIKELKDTIRNSNTTKVMQDDKVITIINEGKRNE